MAPSSKPFSCQECRAVPGYLWKSLLLLMAAVPAPLCRHLIFLKHGHFICRGNRFIFYKQLTRTQIMNPILVWPILLALAVGIRKILK